MHLQAIYSDPSDRFCCLVLLHHVMGLLCAVNPSFTTHVFSALEHQRARMLFLLNNIFPKKIRELGGGGIRAFWDCFFQTLQILGCNQYLQNLCGLHIFFYKERYSLAVQGNFRDLIHIYDSKSLTDDDLAQNHCEQKYYFLLYAPLVSTEKGVLCFLSKTLQHSIAVEH